MNRERGSHPGVAFANLLPNTFRASWFPRLAYRQETNTKQGDKPALKQHTHTIHMQITCFVNQTEAIRRGHDTSSTVKLEVNPADLSQKQRDTLASKFISGSYNNHSHHLKEPTLKGLMEALDACAAAVKKDALEYEKALQEDWEKFDADPRSMMWFSNSDNAARLCGRLTNAEITNNRKAVFDDVQTELRHAHEQHLAKKKKEEQVAALTQATRAAMKRADEDAFRDWNLQNGSPTLQLRIKEGFSWLADAADEWVSSLFAAVGVDDSQRVCDAEGDVDVEAHYAREPSLHEMQALCNFRTALLKELPADKFELSLHNITYTSKQLDNYGIDEYDNITHQTEIQVCITTPHGGNVRRFYKV